MTRRRTWDLVLTFTPIYHYVEKGFHDALYQPEAIITSWCNWMELNHRPSGLHPVKGYHLLL